MDLNNMGEFLDFVRTENKRLLDNFDFKDKSEIVFPQMLKLSEEVGELSEAVLQRSKLQRAKKQNGKVTDVGSELSDVLLVTFLLAENMDIDIVDAVKKKCEKIKNRNYKEE